MNSNYDGTDKRTFINQDIISPEGIAVDWVSRRIYWTDSGKDTIEVASLDNSTMRSVLINRGLVNPRGIAVDPHQKWVSIGDEIWTCLESLCRLAKSSGPIGIDWNRKSNGRTLTEVNVKFWSAHLKWSCRTRWHSRCHLAKFATPMPAIRRLNVRFASETSVTLEADFWTVFRSRHLLKASPSCRWSTGVSLRTCYHWRSLLLVRLDNKENRINWHSRRTQVRHSNTAFQQSQDVWNDSCHRSLPHLLQRM